MQWSFEMGPRPKASLPASTLKLTVTLTLVMNRLLVSFAADPGFFVGFLLTLIWLFLRFADTPFWNRLRLVCLILFWLAWLGLIAAIVTLTIVLPRCTVRICGSSIFWVWSDANPDRHANGRFLKKTTNFGRHESFLWGQWYPCFGLLVMSSLGFKARVNSLYAIDSSDSPPVWHLLRSVCLDSGTWIYWPVALHGFDQIEQF